jgi:hypothetical protein
VTVPDTPEKNGIVKRPHTIQEKARVMMQEAKFRVKYWAEAVKTAVYFKKLSPKKAVKDTPPQEAWHGRKTNVNQLRICDCIGWVLVPKKYGKKGDSKSRECIVGYAENSKAYHIIDTEKPTTVITEENVKFVECFDRNTSMLLKNDKEGVMPYLNPQELLCRHSMCI